MNKNIQLEWISALRSGQYIQTTGHLNAGENQYCAIGVLCSLYIQKNPGRAAWVKECGTYKFAETYGSKVAKVHGTSALPDVVKHWADLRHDDPIFLMPEDDQESGLIELNDDAGEDFHQIADRIECGAER